MYKVTSVDPKTNIETIHWYSNPDEAQNATYALHSHPLFKLRTKSTYLPNAHIGYECE